MNGPREQPWPDSKHVVVPGEMRLIPGRASHARCQTEACLFLTAECVSCADRDRLRVVPGQRSIPNPHHNNSGKVHKEAGGRLELHAQPGELQHMLWVAPGSTLHPSPSWTFPGGPSQGSRLHACMAMVSLKPHNVPSSCAAARLIHCHVLHCLHHHQTKPNARNLRRRTTRLGNFWTTARTGT